MNKFKDQEALQKAYESLEKEFTRRSQKLRELQTQLKDMEEQRDKQAYIAEELVQEKHRWTEQAVEDTAREILIPLMEMEKQIDPLKTGIRWAVLKGFCKKYGIKEN